MKNSQLKRKVLAALVALGFVLSGCQVEGLDNLNSIDTQLMQNSGGTGDYSKDVKGNTQAQEQNSQDLASNQEENSKPQAATPSEDKTELVSLVEKDSSKQDQNTLENKKPFTQTKQDRFKHKNTQEDLRRNNPKPLKNPHLAQNTQENSKQAEPKEEPKPTKKPVIKKTTPKTKPQTTKQNTQEVEKNSTPKNLEPKETPTETKKDQSNTKATTKSGVWRFIVTGDSRGGDNGVNSRVLKRIRDDLINMKPKPAFVIFTGDLVNRGYRYELEYFKKIFQKPLDDNGIKFYPVRGNHDRSASQFAEIFDYLPKNGPSRDRGLTYKVTYKNAAFYFIDGAFGGGRGFARYQLDWLYKNFKEKGFDHRFLIAHSPLWSTGNHTPLYRGSSRALKDLLTKSTNVNLSTYFCGHDHFFDLSIEKASNGKTFRQFLLGTAGAPLYEQEEEVEETSDSLYHYKGYGYSVFEVDGDTIRSWFVPLNGDKKIEYSYIEE